MQTAALCEAESCSALLTAALYFFCCCCCVSLNLACLFKTFPTVFMLFCSLIRRTSPPPFFLHVVFESQNFFPGFTPLSTGSSLPFKTQKKTSAQHCIHAHTHNRTLHSCTHTYIYIYIHTERHKERNQGRRGRGMSLGM